MKIPSNRIDAIARWFRTELAARYEVSEIDTMAAWCLETFAGYTRNDLLLHPESRVNESELLKLHFAVKDLKRGRPLQYILGQAWFFGLTLMVTPDVLIPRPETEELVQLILDEHAANSDHLSVLDIGTGSGCIAIALKNKRPHFEVTALDISSGALAVATANATANKAEIQFIQGDVLDDDFWNKLPNCDIIVSNPPYIRATEQAAMAQHVVEHEPHTALFVPDNDALVFYRAIGHLALKKLNPGGKLYFEINETLGAETQLLLQELGFNKVRLLQDMQGKNRFLALLASREL